MRCLLPLLIVTILLSACSGDIDNTPESGGQAYKRVFSWSVPIDIFGFQPQLRYAYCPSVIEMEDGSCHIFFCGNPDEGKMVDNVFHLFINQDGALSEPVSVLAPTPDAWDSFHCCDPNIIEGLFKMDSHTYKYAMFYLGSDRGDTNGNEIGVAFSNDLNSRAWVKYPKPLLPFSGDNDRYWGIGQPSAISLDRQGQILLSYSCGDEKGTRVEMCEINLRDMSDIKIGEVVRVSSSGFNHLMHNCDFAIDSAHNKIVGAISGDWAKVYPSFIETFVGVAYMDYDSFLKGKGSWMRLPDINSDVSDFYRNHNPGLLRDSFGYLKDYRTPSVFYTIATTGTPCEWSYRICRVDGKLIKQEITE